MEETEKFIESSPNLVPPSPPPPPVAPLKTGVKPGALIVKIIIGIVIVAVVGVGVALAIRIWDPLWNPFRPNPAEVIERMFQNMKNLKAFHADFNLESKDLSSKDGGTVILAIKNDYNKLNADDIRSKGEISYSSLKDNLSLQAEYVTADKQGFLRVVKAPSFMGLDLSFLEGQWISFELSKENLDKTQYQNVDELINKIKEVLIFKDQYKDIIINKEKAYHYVFAFNIDKLKKMAEESYKAASSSIVPINEEDYNSVQEEIEKLRDKKIDCFISKKSEYLLGIKFEEKLDEASANIGLNLSDFNKETDIIAPKDAKSINELLEVFFGGMIKK